jgi:hypothetical protein
MCSEKTAAADAGMFRAAFSARKRAPKPEKGRFQQLAAGLLDRSRRRKLNKIRESLKSKKEIRGCSARTARHSPVWAPLAAGGAQDLWKKSSGCGWGGVNTKMQKKDGTFRSVSKDDSFPHAPLEIVIEVNEEGEQAPPRHIDVCAGNSSGDAAKTPKSFWRAAKAFPRVEIAPVRGPAYPSFHDETTVPLAPQDEEDIARESLSELLSLRSGADAARNVGEKDERFRETKQLQAFLIPAEAMPEADPAAVPIQAGTAGRRRNVRPLLRLTRRLTAP